MIEGIHHITCITGDAEHNLDFYTRVLGLRLTAKTVNQDDPSVYHLFYGEELGRAGADLTFFEYPRATPGRAGAGMAHCIVWRIGAGAADYWRARLEAEGVEVSEGADGGVAFSDFEGLAHELVADDSADEPLIAEHNEIPADMRLRGFAGVRLYSAAPHASAAILQELLGARPAAEGRWELRGERRGGFVHLDPTPGVRPNQSAGSIHHVAFAIPDDEYDQWTQTLDDRGIPSSGPVDRTYFRSLYFREPGGILYELATEGPGFTVDDPIELLGTRVILPPQFEPYREAIERKLHPLPDPRANWPSHS